MGGGGPQILRQINLKNIRGLENSPALSHVNRSIVPIQVFNSRIWEITFFDFDKG